MGYLFGGDAVSAVPFLAHMLDVKSIPLRFEQERFFEIEQFEDG